MALIHHASKSCTKSELDLASIPFTQTTIEGNKLIEIRPVTSITQNSAIDFFISSSTDEILDLNSTRLKITLKIVKGTGGNYTDDDTVNKIGPINYLLGGLFSQVDVTFGDKLVSSLQNYDYLSYIETLLSHSEDVKKNYLGAVGFIQDPDSTDNFNKRTQLTKGSSDFTLYGPLHNDVFRSCRSIISSVDVKIRLSPNKPEFLIQCAPPVGQGAAPADSNPRIIITDISLYVLKLKPSANALLLQENFLHSNNAKYPVTRNALKTHVIPTGQSSANIANLYLGQSLPHRLFVAFVSHASYNGSYESNPYEFKNFGINFLALSVNGVQYPLKPYTPNFENGDFVREFAELYNTLGGTDLGLSLSTFKKDCCIFSFDLTPDRSGAQDLHYSLAQGGTLGLEVRFKQALGAPITLLSYSQKHSVLEINAYRNVLIDAL